MAPIAWFSAGVYGPIDVALARSPFQGFTQKVGGIIHQDM